VKGVTMKRRVLKPPRKIGKLNIFFIIKGLILLILVFLVPLAFAEKIELNGFAYDSNLIGLEPIFTQKVKITSVDKDSGGQVFLNVADGTRVKFLGINILHPDEAIAFLEEQMADMMVYLSYEGKEEDNVGYKRAYVWSDEIYKYYSVSVLWNAVLIINGFALPLNFNYTYNEIFFALESEELETVKTEVEGIKTTEAIKKNITDKIPPGFEAVDWEMKKPEVWYRMNKQLIEERDNKLVYITTLYRESCLLTFMFDEDAAIKSVSYVFSFVDVNHAEETFEKFVKYLNEIIGEDAITEFMEFTKTSDERIEAQCLWEESNATAVLLMRTLSRNVHAMRLTFARNEP